MPLKLVVFDLDGVLTTGDELVIRESLSQLRSNGIKIALASQNARGSLALEVLNIREFFDCVVSKHPFYITSGTDWNSRDDYLTAVASHKQLLVKLVSRQFPDVECHEAVFFDDMLYNCRHVYRLGLHCCAVNSNKGFNEDCVNWMKNLVTDGSRLMFYT